MKFEWNEWKNLANINKHGISFVEAVSVFSDVDAISIHDEDHSEMEERWITIGKIRKHGIIVAVHTERITGKIEYVRLISARKADKYEKNYYISNTGDKQ